MALIEVGQITDPGVTGNQTTATTEACTALYLWTTGRTADGGGSAHGIFGVGYCTDRGGTPQQACSLWSSEDLAAAADTYGGTNSNAALKLHNGTTGALDLVITLTEFNAGGTPGFTLNYTNVLAGAKINYIAFCGADVADATAGTFQGSAGTGAKDVALAAGFGHPDIVFFSTTGNIGLADADASGQISVGFGVRSGSNNGRSWVIHAQDAATTMITQMRIHNATAGYGNGWTTPGTPETVFTLAAESGWPTDGFELNYTTNAAANRSIAYLAIRFSANVTVTTGEGAMSTSIANQTLTSSGTPQLAFLLHTRQTVANTTLATSGATGNPVQAGIGAIGPGGAEAWAAVSDTDAVADAVVGTYYSNTKAMRSYLPSTNALDAEADGAVSGSDFELAVDGRVTDRVAVRVADPRGGWCRTPSATDARDGATYRNLKGTLWHVAQSRAEPQRSLPQHAARRCTAPLASNPGSSRSACSTRP